MTAVGVLAGTAVLIMGTVPQASAAPLPGAALPAAATRWQPYVEGPASATVRAIAAEGRGKVRHARSLVSGHGPDTTLTTTAGDTPASVLLDFGKDVGGVPFLDVREVSGGPTITLVTTEARQYVRTPAATTVTAPAPAGVTRVPLASTAGLEVGNTITFAAAAGPVTGTITGFDTAARTVDLRSPLTRDLPAGTAVSTSPGAPSSDEAPGLAGVGGPATLRPTAPGRLTAGFHGGFRFVLVTVSSPGSVSLSSLGVDFQAFRATPADYRGWFLSSDDQLNRMWYAGAYTLQLNLKAPGLNGLPDARVYDGAKRDRSIWTGDLLVQGPTAVSTLGTVGAQYLRSSLDVLLAQQRADGALPGSPDFAKRTSPQGAPLYYSNNYSGYGARAFVDYYRYTGDKAYLTRVLPALRRELAYNDTFLNADNLVVSNDRDYWQAAQTGEVTKYSIDYYVLLREMAWLERSAGSATAAAADDAKADAIRTAVMTTLWNPRLGAYGQSSTNPDLLVGDANALALRYGFVPRGHEASVLAALRTLWTPHGAIMGPGLQDPTGHTIEPFGNGMETAGRFSVGDTSGALDLMRRTWGPMVDANNPLFTGAFWEFKNSAGTVNRATASLAHGWAASPTVQLTEQVLGVTPVDAGYRSWRIEPHPGDLAWSAGTVPTAYGAIHVGWTARRRAGTFTLTARTPRGTNGTIVVPVRGDARITVNGRTVWRHGNGFAYHATGGDGHVVLTVPGGDYQITTT
ncbi:alpha-L-rhamnosidase C-terminal domain-containing protein [Actinophytocola sp.]|uniref:alpha-L-rhamnosidase C-terminal domain-containing protein n=1 Tax=Actinophytocola sp. TaxID=1872138 RepID=UPI0038998E61